MLGKSFRDSSFFFLSLLSPWNISCASICIHLGDSTLILTTISEWSVIPKSVSQARIEKNFELDGWDLSSAEMKQLDGLTDRFKVCGDGWLPIKVFHGDDE